MYFKACDTSRKMTMDPIGPAHGTRVPPGIASCRDGLQEEELRGPSRKAVSVVSHTRQPQARGDGGKTDDLSASALDGRRNGLSRSISSWDDIFRSVKRLVRATSRRDAREHRKAKADVEEGKRRQNTWRLFDGVLLHVTQNPPWSTDSKMLDLGQFDSGQFELGQFELGQFELGQFDLGKP